MPRILAGTKDPDQIERKLKDIIALAEKTELELNIWLDLVKHTPRSELIVELLSSIDDSIPAVQTTAFNRVLALDKDETLSVSASTRSKLSRTSRHSIKSSKSGSSKKIFFYGQSEMCSVRRENEIYRLD